jgi:hypothetical protein
MFSSLADACFITGVTFCEAMQACGVPSTKQVAVNYAAAYEFFLIRRSVLKSAKFCITKCRAVPRGAFTVQLKVLQGRL